MSYGRVKIHSDAKEITIDNVAREVGRAFALHSKNRIDTEKLWRYYRGDTDIQNKKRDPRRDKSQQKHRRKKPFGGIDFEFIYQNVSLSEMYAVSSEIGSLICSIVSLSRTVTLLSSSVSKSTVTQKGVPISS